MGAFFDMINEFYKYRNLKVIEVLRPHFPTVNLRNLEDLKRLLKYRKYSMIKMLNNFLKEI